MLAMLSAIVRHETVPQLSEDFVLELLGMTPTERILTALRAAGIPSQISLIPHYNHFIGEIGHPEHRKELSNLLHEERFQSEIFHTLKRTADRLRRAIVETIDALPPNWKRHLMHLFLL